MRKLTFSLSVIVLILAGGVRRLDATSEPQAKDFVTVEITVGKEKYFRKAKLPIVFDQKERKYPDYKIEIISYAYTGACPEDTGCQVSIIIQADGVDENACTVEVSSTFDNDRCSGTKELSVVRGKTTELKTRCSTKIKAFYEAQ